MNKRLLSIITSAIMTVTAAGAAIMPAFAAEDTTAMQTVEDELPISPAENEKEYALVEFYAWDIDGADMAGVRYLMTGVSGDEAILFNAGDIKALPENADSETAIMSDGGQLEWYTDAAPLYVELPDGIYHLELIRCPAGYTTAETSLDFIVHKGLVIDKSQRVGMVFDDGRAPATTTTTTTATTTSTTATTTATTSTTTETTTTTEVTTTTETAAPTTTTTTAVTSTTTQAPVTTAVPDEDEPDTTTTIVIPDYATALECPAEVKVNDVFKVSISNPADGKCGEYIIDEISANLEVVEENDGYIMVKAVAAGDGLIRIWEKNCAFSGSAIVKVAESSEELPETGYSKWHDIAAMAAAFLTLTGAAVVIKTKRRENA